MVSATEIYLNFYHAKGTQALSDAQATSFQLAKSYQQQAVDTQHLIDDIQSGWTGDASEAASQGLVPMATNLLETGDALNTHQQLINQQVDAFHTAVSKIRPVPPTPYLWDVVSAVGANTTIGAPAAMPGGISMYDQISAHDQIAQANVDAYNEYVQASQFNASSLPDLSGTLPDKIAAPVSVTPPAGVAAPRRKVSSGPTAPRSSAGPTSHPVAGRPTPVGQGPAGVWTPPPSPIQPTPPVSQSTTPQGVNPPLTANQSPMLTTPPSTALPPSVDGSTGWVTGSVGSISSRLGSGGSGLGVGGFVEPGSAGSRSGVLGGGAASGAREGSHDTAGRRAAGSAAAEEEALASERGTGAMAGRGSRKEQDAEHRRRYTYDEDPDIFDGDLPRTPPPVIGA
jgi:hypothetical protein